MLRVLLGARLRHYVNFVRHHFDRPTLLILATIGVWFGYQAWRSPADVGYSLRAFGVPGFGARWVRALLLTVPALFGAFFLLARLSLRRSPGLDLVRSLPVPDSTLSLWLMARHLSITGPLLVLLALPALGGSPFASAAGVLRAGAVIAGGLSLDYLALRMARMASRAARRGGAKRTRSHASWVPIRGGTVSALVLRDLSYLVRRGRHVSLVLAAAAVLELWVVLAATDMAEALTLAAVIHALHAALQLGMLDMLFERDGVAPGLLKSLPIRGARLWRARALLAAAVLAAPAVIPWIAAIARGAAPAGWAGFLAGAIVALPACGALLYADVHVALFPRTRVATFLLATALAFIVLFWFFVPIATPILLFGLLIHWGLKAAGAFDRLELE